MPSVLSNKIEVLVVNKKSIATLGSSITIKSGTARENNKGSRHIHYTLNHILIVQLHINLNPNILSGLTQRANTVLTLTFFTEAEMLTWQQ